MEAEGVGSVTDDEHGDVDTAALMAATSALKARPSGAEERPAS
jgi:hypothetical protein